MSIPIKLLGVLVMISVGLGGCGGTSIGGFGGCGGTSIGGFGHSGGACLTIFGS